MLGVRPNIIRRSVYSQLARTTVKCRIDIVEKIGSETLLYANLNLEEAYKEKIVDESGDTMIARVDPRTTVQRDEVVTLAFDAKHIHLFLKDTQMSILKRDDLFAGSDIPPKNRL